jgi:hypothetical protein
MRPLLACLFALVVLSLHATAALADAQRIEDPDKYAGEVMSLLSSNDMASVAKKVSDAVGKPSYAENVQNALKALVDKKIDYSDKVVDKTFGNSLRQIVYYCFVENVGFIYFRFNFKMSSRGWILANFLSKSEASKLFPDDFLN